MTDARSPLPAGDSRASRAGPVVFLAVLAVILFGGLFTVLYLLGEEPPQPGPAGHPARSQDASVPKIGGGRQPAPPAGDAIRFRNPSVPNAQCSEGDWIEWDAIGLKEPYQLSAFVLDGIDQRLLQSWPGLTEPRFEVRRLVRRMGAQSPNPMVFRVTVTDSNGVQGITSFCVPR